MTTPRPVTLAEWLAIPEERGAELIDGRIVYKHEPGLEREAQPVFDHGFGQGRLFEATGPWNRKPNDGDRPGGWWISVDVDISLLGQGLRPDLAGWQRDRLPRRPRPAPGGAVTDRPDWVAEVLSPSSAARDLGKKRVLYHAAGVPHYWVLDMADRVLLVFRHSPDGYLLVLTAGADETVHPEPFEALPLDVGALFPEDDEPAPLPLSGEP